MVAAEVTSKVAVPRVPREPLPPPLFHPALSSSESLHSPPPCAPPLPASLRCAAVMVKAALAMIQALTVTARFVRETSAVVAGEAEEQEVAIGTEVARPN